MTPPDLNPFIPDEHLRTLLTLAREEDLGPRQRQHDITSELVIPADAEATVAVVAREPGTLAGLATLDTLLHVFDADLQQTRHAQDASTVRAGDPVLTLSGNLRTLLAVERPLLNLLSHLSGIATETARLCGLIEETNARLCDTRKTIPGWRGLDKYAVVCGGGTSHRRGLYDAVLIKDNHIADVPDDRLTRLLRGWIDTARSAFPDLMFFEIEIDRLAQLPPVLEARPDIVLLDNMAPDTLREAVALRDRLAPDVRLEASGGITEQTLRSVAETGVDRISVGALTHTVRALDLGVDRSRG
ncbi:carboxylating nicotinate-nucleotide diphosphorylase [Mucisphaera calidilacus]|uniref:nicotinate-nucleotide diphosphorylase (carboxylating) n=1 Tax=Mucisphaera calidilacus TaxID=2527982 RepID=A0A518BWE6_9BACT|nr:carboxylating nicotinate-nucleotide diphosphorylase [Mucisphaera calidilacus]QDU71297.1 Nicotinate-nucleotide pyrophosphorylase [carboxylating] [Mucisphaera calidilacus]